MSNKKLNGSKIFMAIAAGLGVLTVGSGVAYWHYSQRQWCVQFTSGGGQEVTYSRGCLTPQQRYKKWTLTAEAHPKPIMRRL